MATVERRVAVGRRAGVRARNVIGDELRAARLQAGVSQRAVGEAAGCSGAEISRLERGASAWLSVETIFTVAAVLGLEASLKVYPGGSPIRDAAHLALLDRLRQVLHPTLAWRTEVPLPISGDLRAWDAAVTGPGWRIGVDAETRIRDVQAFERRLALKQRDAGGIDVVLLLAGTRSNRAALAAARTALRGLLPYDTTDVLAALRAGERPPGSGIVVL
jgi:transcriptional regulator with XRE-family HTH domain